jgi:hypothetical protein
LHWQDFHPLDHQFSFTALSRRTNIAIALSRPEVRQPSDYRVLL